MVVSVSATPVAYAVYSNGTLTFKYGEMSQDDLRLDYYLVSDTGGGFPGWRNNSIERVIFDTSFATARPKSCRGWFYGLKELKEITGIGNLNTSDVTDMYYMFYGCSGLTSLDVSGFNTSNVTTMSGMFCDCSGLTSLDVSGFNTSNVRYISYMFRNCSSLTSLDVSGFDTFNVYYMDEMFFGCSSLKTIYCDDAWNCPDWPSATIRMPSTF